MPELHGPLQLLRIKHPPLGAAQTPTIRKDRWAVRPEGCQPLASGALAESLFPSQLSKVLALLQLLTDQTFPTNQCKAGFGATMHVDVSSGLAGRTSPRRGPTPHFPLTNSLRQTT